MIYGLAFHAVRLVDAGVDPGGKVVAVGWTRRFPASKAAYLRYL